jgi:predicted glycoside hydrolase/deacetylase ChbG (UPF0249 family)
VRRLIVNADDFGLTCGVNRAIVELHRNHLLTSATLMANAPGTEDAVSASLENPSLAVGCHVVLVDGRPVLPAHLLSTLVRAGKGQFHRTLGQFLRRLVVGRIKQAEIEAEAAAQIARLKNAGIRLTHVDTHKHTHMFAAVLRPLLRAAKGAGIFAVRNPFESAWSRYATPAAPMFRRVEVTLLHGLERSFRHIVAEEGCVTTNGSMGVLATGTLDSGTIRGMLASMPPGTWELVTHPGYNDDDLAHADTRLTQSRQVEFQALPVLREMRNFDLISYANLVPAAVVSWPHSALK